MKKRAFLAVFLVVVMVISLLATVTAFAATRPAKGSLNDLTSAKNGYYYTNEDFSYSKHEDATSVRYWFYSMSVFVDTVKAHGDGVRAYVLDIDAGSRRESTSEKVDFDASAEGYYVIMDYYAQPEEEQDNYSDNTVVCVDLTAPVVDIAKFEAWLLDEENETGFDNQFILGTKDWEVPVGWAYDVDIVTELSAVIEVTEEADEDDENSQPTTRLENSKDLLNVYVEYLSPNDYYDGEWDNTEGSTKFALTTVGIWYFRFVVKDMAGNVAVGADGTSEYIYETQRNVRDLTPPTIKYSTTQLKVQTAGTVAGQAYSIPTPTYSDEISSTSIYYQVFKRIGNDWVVIYDSQTDVITEGYEDYVAKGKLTPGVDEVTPNDGDILPNYQYRIVHTVTDSQGNSASAELNILVTQPDVDAYNVWKIVLIIIASLSAVGIVVLIFVKPKEQELHYAGNVVTQSHQELATSESKDDNKQEKTK